MTKRHFWKAKILLNFLVLVIIVSLFSTVFISKEILAQPVTQISASQTTEAARVFRSQEAKLPSAHQQHAHASPLSLQTTGCQDIEVVLIVDQSGSMRGVQRPAPTDPLELRFYGTEFAVNWIGTYYLGNQNVPGTTPKIFHMAVVNFGDTANVALNWESITPNDTNVQLAQANSVQQQVYTDENMGNTNFVSAFQQAADLFDQRGPQVGGCPQRNVIVLTDGRPAVPEQEGFSIGGHMSEIENIVNSRMQGANIYITAINDPSDLEYWNLTEGYWQNISQNNSTSQVAGAELVRNVDEIGARLTNILSSLSGAAINRIQLGEYVVVPYLQQLCLIFYKRDPQAEHLLVADQQGTQIDANYPDTTVIGFDQPIETLCVDRPQPGKWEVQTTTGRPDVIIDAFPISAGGALRAPTGNAQQFVEIPIEFQLIDQSGNALPEYADPRYDIVLTATIQAGNSTWSIRPNKQPDQTFTASFIPLETGQHTLNVRGQTRDANNNTVNVIDGDIGNFLVEPVTLDLIQNTGSGGRCPDIQENESVSLAYVFRDQNNNKVTIDLPLKWDVTLETEDGQLTDLTMQGPDVTGVYSTTFTPTDPGSYEAHMNARLVEPITGNEREIEDRTVRFDVVPTDLVQVNLIEPSTSNRLGQQVQFQWQPWFVRLDPRALPIEVELINQTTGTPITLANVTSVPPEDLLEVEVRNKDTGNPVQITNPLQPTGDAGHLRTLVAGVDLNTYNIRVIPDNNASLKCGWAWATVPASTDVTLVQDPLLYVLWSILAGFCAMLLFTGYRFWSITRHPMMGWLVILDDQGKKVGDLLPLAGRNRHVFRSGIRPDVGVKSLEVFNQPGWEKDNRIQVRYKVRRSKVPIAPDPIMPNEPIDLENGYLLKYVTDTDVLSSFKT